MEAYKCDVCGKLVENAYRNDGDVFDLYLEDLRKLGYPTNNGVIKIRDMCPDCFNDIKTHIHNRYRNFH